MLYSTTLVFLPVIFLRHLTGEHINRWLFDKSERIIGSGHSSLLAPQ